jgi:hypothetical protein
MAGIMGERGRTEQQEDQDNPHHHRRPRLTPFLKEKLPFCPAAARSFERCSQDWGADLSPRPYLFCAVYTPARTPAPNRERRNGSGSKREQHCYRLSRRACEASRWRLRFRIDRRRRFMMWYHASREGGACDLSPPGAVFDRQAFVGVLRLRTTGQEPGSAAGRDIPARGLKAKK